MTLENPFKRTENDYFRLRGQLETGRITREQFETALKNLMVQDPQGRWWMLGVESGKWYVHNRQKWVEADPYSAQSSVPQEPAPPAPFATPADAPSAPPYVTPPTLVGTPTARLIITHGSANQPFVDLPRGVVTIGRAPTCTLILNESLASRQHASVDFRDGAWVISDMYSRNGTLVNGMRITRQNLRPGDQIQIGNTIIVFQV